MDWLITIAKTTQTAAEIDYETKYVLQCLDYIWQQATALNWLQAVLAISFGLIYLMYGWRIYKALTVINFALVGLYIGMWLGAQFEKTLLGAVVGGCLLALLAIPLMRWAVCLLGALAGGILACGMWYAFNGPQQYVWAGGLVGVAVGGMISFIIFKLAVMLFTSLAGGSLIIVGGFSLIYQFETFINDPPTTHLNELYYSNHWFMPVILVGITFFGMLLQHKFVTGSKDWSV
jgi:hypothetical protein